MEVWNQLRKAALLGTQRHEAMLTGSGAIGAFLEAVDRRETSKEHKLLDAAAGLTLYRRAGMLPAATHAAFPPEAPPETRRVVSKRCLRHLESLLASQDIPLLSEWLDLCDRTRQRVPAHVIPEVLEYGWTHDTIWTKILAVTGERGHWLCAIHPDWSVRAVAGTHFAESADDWETSTSSERARYLRELRKADATRARTLLEGAFTKEHARERALLLATLAVGLGDPDEPFLEDCLDDRSKEVRRIAADLLAKLPSSRFAARAVQRATAHIKLERAGEQWVFKVDLPKKLAPEMLRDGIQEDPPRKQGRRAFWLRQMAELVPPSQWEIHWGGTCEQLVKAALASDWGDALVSAWTNAVTRHVDPHWATVLLEQVPEHGIALWQVLPQAERESLMEHRLSAAVGAKDVATLRLLIEALSEFRGEWAPHFSNRVGAALRTLALRDTESYVSYPLRQWVHAIARKLHPDILLDIEAAFTSVTLRDHWQAVAEELIDTLRFRAELREHLQRQKPDNLP